MDQMFSKDLFSIEQVESVQIDFPSQSRSYLKNGPIQKLGVPLMWCHWEKMTFKFI